MSSAVKLCWDGNSLVSQTSGVGATSGNTLPEQVAARAPFLGSGATFGNVALGGQTWAHMISAATDIDALYDSSRTNVLICWETTNSIYNNGLTGMQAVADCVTYMAARRAAQPAWISVLLTTIPRIGDSTQNAAMNVFDAYARANYRAMGWDALCDVRRLCPVLDFDGSVVGNFAATQQYWYEPAGAAVHLNDAGYSLIATAVASTLRGLPPRRRT